MRYLSFLLLHLTMFHELTQKYYFSFSGVLLCLAIYSVNESFFIFLTYMLNNLPSNVLHYLFYKIRFYFRSKNRMKNIELGNFDFNKYEEKFILTYLISVGT